jgi:hypothetical protein
MVEEIDGVGDKVSDDTTTLALVNMSLRYAYFIDEAFFFFFKKQNYDLGTTLF